eukprot:TRINITY_DN9031_c0_g1_i10.p1 TRINITY_DN9031_c0_g1~~TRINITY_DN9031_c0_g1_i10.p1  ORF type:complete len:536 (+),score=26.09 TRINITY_DN9031_c0_g1_i10:305-1912(+)
MPRNAKPVEVRWDALPPGSELGHRSSTRVHTTGAGNALSTACSCQYTPKRRRSAIELRPHEVMRNHNGRCYQDGKGVAQNDVAAAEWFQLAAAQGHLDAQCELGQCYQAQFELAQRYYEGRGVAQNYATAVKWYQAAASHGHAEAQYQLGQCYAAGLGVPQHDGNAVQWYRAASEQGHMHAQFSLAVCYQYGRGVPPDQGEAVKWYQVAATQHHAGAQHCLGLCFEHGIGVAKHNATAVKWYRDAASQLHAEAQYRLAQCFENGVGVPQDETTAMMFFQAAATAPFLLEVCFERMFDVEFRRRPLDWPRIQRLLEQAQRRKATASLRQANIKLAQHRGSLSRALQSGNVLEICSAWQLLHTFPDREVALAHDILQHQVPPRIYNLWPEPVQKEPVQLDPAYKGMARMDEILALVLHDEAGDIKQQEQECIYRFPLNSPIRLQNQRRLALQKLQPMGYFEAQYRGVPYLVLRSLPTRFYHASASGSHPNECIVCLSQYEAGDELRTLPCLHHFHCKCIDDWLCRNNSCPMCKHPVC